VNQRNIRLLRVDYILPKIKKIFEVYNKTLVLSYMKIVYTYRLVREEDVCRRQKEMLIDRHLLFAFSTLYLIVYPFYIYLMGYIYPFNGRTRKMSIFIAFIRRF